MSRLLEVDFQRDVDLRDQPMYTVGEVAQYVGVRSMTLLTWLYGRTYHTKQGQKMWKPVIKPASEDKALLSFYNLAEAHILASTRYQHKVSFPVIREAIDYVRKHSGNGHPVNEHPLLSRDFYTDGRDIFVQSIQETVRISRGVQLGFKPILDLYLKHIVWDKQYKPVKVFPIIKGQADDKVISIMPTVSSGRPTIDGTGVQVFILWKRWQAGEEYATIADDFDIPVAKVKRAIEYVENREDRKAA
jgi:uncharacterized protein (DUF433 family)